MCIESSVLKGLAALSGAMYVDWSGPNMSKDTGPCIALVKIGGTSEQTYLCSAFLSIRLASDPWFQAGADQKVHLRADLISAGNQ